MRKRLASIVKLCLSVGLLALVLARVGLRQAAVTLASARWPLLGLALALYIASIALRSLRWRALLRAKRIEVPLARLVVLYYVGSFFNIMLPAGVGGDAVRAYELSRYTDTLEAAIGTVLIDRAIGLLVLFVLAALVLPFGAGLLPLWVAGLVIALTAASLGGLALLFWGRPLEQAFRRLPPRLQELIGRPVMRKLYRSFTGYDRRSLAVAVSVSFVFNLLLIAVNVLIGQALGAQVSIGHYVVFVSLTSFLSALPISIGGLGVREGGYSLLFGQVGVPQTVAVSMSLAFYLINVLAGLIGGVLYASEGARGAWHPTQKESSSA